MNTKDAVIKHSAIIQITHKISLLEQHLFNALLAESFNDLKTKQIHVISISTLKKYVPGIHSVKNLKIMLKNLRDTSIEYNLFEKDKVKEWGVLSLLSGVRIGEFNKFCYFSFTPELIPALSDPRIYSKINLNLQKKYKGGKAGWGLYELCWDYKSSISKGKTPEIGKTPTMTIDQLKDFFGTPPGKYSEYKSFNRRIILPAVKEVNKQTDIYITPELKKKGQAVHSIIFHVTCNPTYIGNLINITPADKQLTVDDKVILLHTMDVSDKKIKTLIKQYDLKQIQEVCQVYKEANKPAIKSIDSWITIALKDAWVSKATERRRLSIISLEANKKAVKAESEAKKELKDKQKEEDCKAQNLYESSSRFGRFNLCLDSMMPDLRECHDKLDDQTKQNFKDTISDSLLNYDFFKDARIFFMDELIKFLKER